jgi:hypothetical protein
MRTTCQAYEPRLRALLLFSVDDECGVTISRKEDREAVRERYVVR